MRERILIVDDNKALAKLIAKKMEQQLDMEIVVAHSFGEAKEILEENDDFFVALLDLNLPDAPNGEIVDFVLSLNILVIVLTGSMDEETKNTFMNKNIVDYVVKSSMSNIDYIFEMIERLDKNRNYKVMVVDSKAQTRNAIKKALSEWQFRVLAAAHGEEALSYLRDNPDIKFIVTEYKMPIIDGFDLIQEIRQTHEKNKLGIAVMFEPEETIQATRFLKNGANGFIVRPVSKESLITCVNDGIELLEYAELNANFKNIDYLTKLPNRTRFFAIAKEYFRILGETQVTFASVNIDSFSALNSRLGYEAGDFIVEKLSQIIMSQIGEISIVSRSGKDEFSVIFKDISYDDAVKKMVEIRASVSSAKERFNGDEIRFSVSIGVASGAANLGVEILSLNSLKAVKKAKENGGDRVEIL